MMPVGVRRFDSAKALETLLYVAEHTCAPSFHSVSKLLYFADKIHLERYGRFITGDDYVAMKHGPVPSGTYDLMKAPVGRTVLPCHLMDQIEAAFDVVKNYEIRPKRAADRNRLSLSELECLDESIRNHGGKTFRALTDLSHDQAWNAADENDFIGLEQVAQTLPNASEVLEYLRR